MSLLWDFFNRHVVVLFETSVLKEVRILRSPYLHNNSTVLILMLMLRSKIKLSYTLLKHTRDNHTRNTMRQIRFCSSFKSENGRKSLVQIMQNQCELGFFFVVACRLVYWFCYSFSAPMCRIYRTEYYHDFSLQACNKFYKRN